MFYRISREVACVWVMHVYAYSPALEQDWHMHILYTKDTIVLQHKGEEVSVMQCSCSLTGSKVLYLPNMTS